LLADCFLLPVVEATTVVARLRLLRQHLTQLNYQHQPDPKW
jgi:hypothetical protein